MASVQSLGVGSGIDLQSLVEGLVATETQVRLGRLDSREGNATAKISAYGNLKSAVSQFNDTLNTLADISTFRSRNVSSSNEDSFTVSASSDAALGTYNIGVTQAGIAQTLSASGIVDVTNTALDSADIAIGGGTLTIQQGTQPSFDVDISSASSSLNDIVKAINEAEDNTGVSASVINADSGPVLVINATETGSDNDISISVTDIDGDTEDSIGLSQLRFDAGTGSRFTEIAAALDTIITVNGVSITSTSGSTFSDVVSGVSITAISETTSDGTATITQDVAKATEAIDAFIENFNGLIDNVNDLGRAGTEDAQSSSPLVGDSVLRNLTSQLRRTIFSTIDETQPEGVQTLSDIGINVDRNGKLELDSSKLGDLLESNFDDVARLLAADGNPISQQQELSTVSYDAVSSLVGSGQLDIAVGEDSFSITIGGSDTLQTLRDAINSATDNTGVTASIILEDDGGGGTDAKLLLTADEAGTEQQITITVDDDDGNDTDLTGLSILATDNLTELVNAELDAPEGVIVRLQEVVATYLGGSGEQGIIDARTEGLNADIERINDERLLQQTRLEQYEARLVQQFASLDLLVANLQSSGDFLLSQLSSAAQITNNRNSS